MNHVNGPRPSSLLLAPALALGAVLLTVSAAGCSSSPGITGDMADVHQGTDVTHPDVPRPVDAGGDGGTDGPGPDGPVGTDASSPLITDPISASADSQNEHEPQIAVAPGGRTIVSFNAYISGGITVGYRISNDFGTTWGPVMLWPIPSDDNTQSNATVFATADGSLYMAWASESHTQAGRSNIRVWAAKAGPTEDTLGTPVQVNDPAITPLVIDLPVIAVTASGRAHVVYNQTLSDGNTTTLVDATSTDFVTWTRRDAVGAGSFQSFRNGARICLADGPGRIYLVHHDSDLAYYQSDLGLSLRYSDDDGLTWSAGIAVQTPDDEINVAFQRAKCVTRGDDVWVLYEISPVTNLVDTSTTVPALTQLRLAHSGDRGQTIDSRTDVAGDDRPVLLNSALALEEGGAIDIAYYTGWKPQDAAASFRRRRSTDGVNFAPAQVVQPGLTLETSRRAHSWIGDYVGMAAAAGQLFIVYTDNAGGTAHIAFARSAPDAPGQADPSDGPAPSDAGVPVTPPACLVTTPFQASPWAPPTAFGQNACSPTQLTAYQTCLGSATGDCSAFRADSANAACVGCLETDLAAEAHGPILTQMVSGQLTVVDLNGGGCQAHYDGDTSATGCGAQINASNDCTVQACGTCSDYANPAYYGPTYDCAYTSWEPDGVCGQARVATSCVYASQCNDLASILTAWCGAGS
jgi:hypothetical protein